MTTTDARGTRAAGPLRSPLGWAVAAALSVSAAAHIPVIPAHLWEATYMGAAFAVFTFAALTLAALALQHDTRVVYGLSVVLALAAVLTYAGTRVVAFPLLADDVGNWAEPLGVVAVAAELAAAGAAAAALRGQPRAETD